MTDTDATMRPLVMPGHFTPYLEKHRIYKLFKDLVNDLVLHLPKDHLKHTKMFLTKHAQTQNNIYRIFVLVSPELKLDVHEVIKEILHGMNLFVITRRCVIDRYEKAETFETNCYSPELLSEVTKSLTNKDQVQQAGWVMFDHPCTVREAKCLQQDGVLPTITLVLQPPAPVVPVTLRPLTTSRNFFNQDFEGLKIAYKATLKEVEIGDSENIEQISAKCFNAIQACIAGAQGTGQGHHVVGNPGVYRVLLLGPRGSGRTTQAQLLSKNFGLVYLNYNDLLREAKAKNDEVGERLRKYGLCSADKAEILRRRFLKKDCLDLGWVLIGFPNVGAEFELLDNMKTPPNRIIFLNADMPTCKKRELAIGVDWCTGQEQQIGSGSRAMPKRPELEAELERDLEFYFTEALSELHAAAGITAVDIDASQSIEQVQVKIQAAVMAAPSFNLEELKTD